MESRFSMVELYRKLFLETSHEPGAGQGAEELGHRSEDRDRRDAELLAIWRSLEFFEKRAGRSMPSAEFGRLKKQASDHIGSSLFDRKSLVTMWTHAELAWQDGWPCPPDARGGEIEFGFP